METKIEEKKIQVAKRIPPGDRWESLDGAKVLTDNLTEMLEYTYQQRGNTQFYMDAREGFVYVVTTEEIEVIPPPPEPPKTWSLYGED